MKQPEQRTKALHTPVSTGIHMFLPAVGSQGAQKHPLVCSLRHLAAVGKAEVVAAVGKAEVVAAVGMVEVVVAAGTAGVVAAGTDVGATSTAASAERTWGSAGARPSGYSGRTG